LAVSCQQSAVSRQHFQGKRLNEISAESVRNNEKEGRFELDVDGELAVSYYKIRGKTIYFTHTEVPSAAEGRGIGNILARVALDYARANRLRVVPRCKFIAAFIKRHPEYQELVDADDES
jgi:predicted GNAT family acetyltransferase